MLIVAMLLLAVPQEAPAAPDATIAAPRQEADGTQRWSILAPACSASQEDIVVCGTAAASPRLPLPGERGPPDRPMPSNPDMSGMGALAAASPPCATRSEGCTTGIDLFGGGTFLVRAVGKLIDPDSCCETPGEATNPVGLINDIGSVVKRTFRKKPDKSKRVPIPLEDPAP